MPLIWAAEPETVADSVLIARIESMTFGGITPRSASAVRLLGALSQRLLEDPTSRDVPQYVALAYWLRPAALNRMVTELAQRDSAASVRVPRGIALHLPPTNVDTLFVYSWAMSVLAGNANVVRLADELSMEAQWLARTVSEVVSQEGEASRQLFCHYPYGGEVEKLIAGYCDLRLIWGGDAKVDAVSRVPIRPDGLSIGFPDRKSIAAISSEAYEDADEIERNKLVKRFFNDVFWFDQMGCGSPRLLVWVGDPGDLALDFYDRLTSEIFGRGYTVKAATAIDKFGLANALLADGVINNYVHFGAALDVGRAVDPRMALERTRGGGFLCDWVAHSIEDLLPVLTRRLQTITYFGIASEELMQLAHCMSGRGGYRIVPVGEALQFDSVWDGVDLFQHMTRQIVVR